MAAGPATIENATGRPLVALAVSGAAALLAARSASAEPQPAKRKWIPKEEYKKSKGIETPRDSKWRPGGAHRDPRQKYKDAKKAKWSRFKQNIRQKSDEKRGRKKDDDK